MPINRPLRCFTVLVACCLVVEAAASDPGTVVNRSQGVELAESTNFDRLLGIEAGAGGLSLAPGATQGLAADSLQSPVPATHLGLSWSAKYNEGRVGLAVRTSIDGAEWSDWLGVRIDEHLTDHENRVFYSRLIHVPGGYRYVQYSAGLERTQAGDGSPVLNALDMAFIDAGSSATGGPETDVTDQPPMLSRTEWGCPDGETSSNNPNPTYTDPTHLIVHHTATSNNATDWAAEVRAMWSYHVQTRGWADIGYNFLVDPNGVIYVGRAGGDNVQGAHFTCQNAGTQGVAVIGNFTSVAPTDAALDSLEDLLAWLASREGLDPVAVTWHSGTQLDLHTISGHRDGNPSATGCTVTACPGDTFYPMLPGLRVNVEALIAAAQVPDPLIEDQLSEVVAAFGGDAEAGADCWGLFEVNGHIVANLFTDEHGCALHRIEPNGEHTRLSDVDTTPPAPWPHGISPVAFGASPPLDGWYFFEGTDGRDGFWRTDGDLVEPVFGPGEWPEGGTLSGRGVLNGRLYFTVWVEGSNDRHALYSTDGSAVRFESDLESLGDGSARIRGSFHDRLLLVGRDAGNVHGVEPWVYDGQAFSLLQDIAPGDAGSYPLLFSMLDDAWFFSAQPTPGASALFGTDGENLWALPDGPDWLYDLDDFDPGVKAGGAVHIVRATNPGAPVPPRAAPVEVLRYDRHALSGYTLGDVTVAGAYPSMAVLGDEALVEIEGRFFRLGESSAEELPYNFPTDQADVEHRFIGSDPGFPFAFVEETGPGDHSRVWVWTDDRIGRLLAADGGEITRADHFRHIGEDIWFYGEDAVNGRALRRIPGAGRPATPWMGAVTGAWYDPATDGQGFVLHPIDERRSVISFYGYEADGSQLWLLGTGETGFEPGVAAEVTMFRSSGGNFGDFVPDQIDTLPWGTLEVNFHTCREASAELDGETGRQELALVRLAGLAGLECMARTPPLPPLSGVTGTWYERATDGQGFVLHAIDDTRILVSFYGYREDGRRLWLLGVFEGEPAFGQPLTVDMSLAEGGAFGAFDPLEIMRKPWGTLTITFEGCGKATAALDGLDGQQSLNLVKLAGLAGSERDCVAPTTSAAKSD